jgi:sterol desaturase/sphingolipid hydroxylase (fatty acid hydroxylase superfamily)
LQAQRALIQYAHFLFHNHVIMEIANPLVYAVPFFLTLLVVEFCISRIEGKKLYDVKDLFASATMGLGAVILGPLTRVMSLGLYYYIFEATKGLRLEWFGFEELGWAWWVWLLAILGDDFNFYWHHRFSHTIRVLWAAHVVHHSSENYNLGTGIRNGWVTLFYKPLWWIWMPLLGFHPLIIATAIALNSSYQLGLHTQYVPKLGWLEHIFNTPMLHQVHHSCNVEYLDKNHGGIFIFWDKMFGTFQDYDKSIKPEFGVLTKPGSHNPLVVLTHEYKNIWDDVKTAPTWKDKLKYIFYEPGWSHDGSRMTAKQMQEQLEKEKRLQAQAAKKQDAIAQSLVAKSELSV